MDDYFQIALLNGMTLGLIFTGNKSCGDYMFSGHAATIFLLTLFIMYYAKMNKIIKIFVLVWTLVCCILIILSRMHYTIDVIIAILISFWNFMTYHLVVIIENLKSSDPSHRNDKKWLKLRRVTCYSNVIAHLFERKYSDFNTTRLLQSDLSNLSYNVV
ncbi:Sphingomyelin synthase-related 1 [Thelohanellus kitauei]|uniref:Sphingomyelin synthase-related 1 n=1 Tax=Thelohanellus kitauei TaxID=669202 RepID=A0A0C2MX40_THEKT|nr:Sphingomyelin synthase-related 1 [Thelohanellus kitauei]